MSRSIVIVSGRDAQFNQILGDAIEKALLTLVDADPGDEVDIVITETEMAPRLPATIGASRRHSHTKWSAV